MREIKLQSRYANSLYILAKEDNILDKVLRDILSIKDLCIKSHEFQVILRNPVIKPNLKKQIINSLFKDTCEELTIKFLLLIIEKRRDIYLLGICEEFINIYNKEHNIKKARLVVAEDISPSLQEEIRNRLQNSLQANIDLETEVDDRILGGFSLTVDDKQYDASFRKKLLDLRNELLQTQK